MSVRLHIIVEGQTEEAFVNQVLAEPLALLGIFAAARSVETSRRRSRIFRGGMTSYSRLKGDLLRWMHQDDNPEVWFTTMIDLYGLDRLPDGFPGFVGSQAQPPLP